MTIYELQQRAVALRSKTQTASITPDEVGGLHVDTLAYIAEFERETNGLGIRKVYRTKAEMEADTTPIGTNGKTLQYGQLVCIYNEADNTNVNNGDIYAYQKPGWLRVGNISHINKLLLKINKEEEARKKQFDDLNSLIARGLTVRFNGFLDDAEISHISASNVDGVYYISSKKMFAGKSGNRYVNNWTGADMYLNDDRTAICEDKVYLLGADVYAWNKNVGTLENITVTLQKSLAEESKTRKKEFDGLNSLIARGLTIRFNGFLDDAEISQISASNVDGVYYISSKKMFAGKSGRNYVNNWIGADMYLNEVRTEILKDKIYLCANSIYFWDSTVGELVKVGAGAGIGLQIVSHSTSENSFVLTPGVLHVWPIMQHLTLTFAKAEDGFVGEYCFQFTCPDDAGATLELPAGIKWYGGKVVVPEASKTYQASVVNNVIIMGGAE